MAHLRLRGKDKGAATAAPVIIFLKRHYLIWCMHFLRQFLAILIQVGYPWIENGKDSIANRWQINSS